MIPRAPRGERKERIEDEEDDCADPDDASRGFPEDHYRGREREEDGNDTGDEEWMIKDAEERGVEEDEIWEMEEGEVAVRLEPVVSEGGGGGDELVLVVIEIPPHRGEEKKREDDSQKGDREEAAHAFWM